MLPTIYWLCGKIQARVVSGQAAASTDSTLFTYTKNSKNQALYAVTGTANAPAISFQSLDPINWGSRRWWRTLVSLNESVKWFGTNTNWLSLMSLRDGEQRTQVGLCVYLEESLWILSLMLLSASNLCLLLLDMYLPLSHSSIPCHYACRSPHFNSRVWSKSDLGMASVIFTFKFDAVSNRFT